MARSLALLRYQLVAYWRGAFAVRGAYDAGSGFLLLVLVASAFRFVSILRETAASMSRGESEGLSVLLTIVFLSWMMPALETQRFSALSAKLAHLPAKRTDLAVVNMAAVFLLPMSVLSCLISLAAVYPFLFSRNSSFGLIAFALFVLFSAGVNLAIINLLSLSFGRAAILILVAAAALLLLSGSLGLPLDIPATLQSPAADSFVQPTAKSAVVLLAGVISVCLIAFFSARRSISERVRSQGKRRLGLLNGIKVPLKYGSMIKKDLLFSWTTIDFWTSLLAALLYAVLLIAGDFSFRGFGPALAILVALSSGLAFNVFGVDSSSAIERLSLFPIKPRDLLTAKHRTFALIVLSETFFLFPLALYKFGPLLFCVAVIKVVSLVLLYTAWGNHLSISHPFQMYQYQVSFGGSWGAMLYGTVAITLITVAPEMVNSDGAALQLILNVVVLLLAWGMYRFSLRRNSHRLSESWRSIAFRLS